MKKNKTSNETTSGKHTGLRVLLAFLVALIGIFVVFVRVTYGSPTPGDEISLDRLYRMADSGYVLSATLLDEDAVVVGELCPDGVDLSSGEPECSGETQAFHASYPGSDVATQQLIQSLTGQARVEVDRQSTKAIAKLVTTFVLPLVLLAVLFGIIFFMAKDEDSSMAEIAGFGRMRRKRQREEASGTGVTFEDVAGVDEAIDELKEVIDYLKQPEKYERFGAVAPRGVLLFGPPGCGKTLMARAVAGESGVPFVSVSGTEFVESLVGVGAARVRDLFDNVRDLAPAIVFIDEIDAVGRRREGEGVSGGEREQTLNQLLVEMDGFDVSSGVVIMAATNRPDILDAALLRPGRFDRQITLDPPDVEGREAILEVHAAKRNVSPDVDFRLLARRTPGFTGADLASVMNEAVLLAIREGTDDALIEPRHVSEAVERVLHGPHRGKLMSPEERERIAYHESGHALVAAAYGRADEVIRVSVVARGRGLGGASVSNGDRVLLTGDELESELAIALGGVAAEELIFDGPSTAAEDDIGRATALAKEMIGIHGMSGELGRVQLLTRFGGYTGGQGFAVDPTVSEQTLDVFAAEVKGLVARGEATATTVLDAHRDVLASMVERLKTDETLEGGALEEFLSEIERIGPSTGNGHRPKSTSKRSSSRKKATAKSKDG